MGLPTASTDYSIHVRSDERAMVKLAHFKSKSPFPCSTHARIKSAYGFSLDLNTSTSLNVLVIAFFGQYYYN